MAFLKPLAYGADSNLFNGHTTIDLSNNLLNFNLSALADNTDSRVLKTQYFNAISYIWTNILSNPDLTRQQIYEDEFSNIMDPRYPDIMLYNQTIEKRIRKYYGGLTTATQQISDVLKDSVKDQGEAIIENSCYQFYFGLGANGIKYFNDTSWIPESETEFIKHAGIGQCYAKFGSATAMRMRITVPQNILDLFNAMKG